MADLILKQARAIVDDRTTVICLDVHGVIMPVDMPFETLAGDFMSPPFHVHCRTLVGPFMAGFVKDARKEANAELMKRPKKERRKGPDGPAGAIPGPVTGNPPSGFSRQDNTDKHNDAELFTAPPAPVKIPRVPGNYDPKVEYGFGEDQFGDDIASSIRSMALFVNSSLHGLTPEAKKVPFLHDVNAARNGENGHFDPVKQVIMLDYRKKDVVATAAHELGHMVDHMVLNDGRQGSAVETVLLQEEPHPLEHEIRAWWDAIEGSVSGDKILQAFYEGEDNASYLAQHQEFFARSYSQWVAEKMGDPDLSKELLKVIDHRQGYEGYEQWGKEEFGPISDALDALFLKQDHPELFPAEKKALTGADRLKAEFDAGYTGTTDHIWQGNRAEVEIGTLADGTKVVRKTVKEEEEADKEYLSSLLGNALGIEVYTAKVGPTELVMDYIEGQTGNGWLNEHRKDYPMDWSIKSSQKMNDDRDRRADEAMMTMEGGKLIGLMDFLIENPDRHAGNWMIRDGKVYPIDHGNSRFAATKYDDYDTGKPMELFNGSPFSVYWLGAKLTKYGEIRSLKPSAHWTLAELTGIREQVAALEGQFAAHPDWLEYALSQIDRLIGMVKK